LKNIATALVKAQREFGPALKSSTNPHFKSKYADLAACVEAVIDGLNNNGIALIQPMHESDNGVTVETLFVHESGEMLSAGKLHVPAAKQDPQGYGSALTYARRYSLMAACGIAPEDDDGNAAKKPSKPALEKAFAAPHKPTDGAMEALPADERQYIKELADDVCAIAGDKSRGIATAFDRIEVEGLDNDQMVALWSLLPSNVRSGLKAEKGLRIGAV